MPLPSFHFQDADPESRMQPAKHGVSAIRANGNFYHIHRCGGLDPDFVIQAA
jgi:hypothetical protein